MKYLLYFALFGAAVFTACGDDSSNPVINEGTSSSFVSNISSSSAVSSVPDGSFVDSRDGQVYKMVTIGNQVWMAQNLNFESPDSYCYEDKKDNCTKYGRLYKWSAAMDSAGLYSENGKGCGHEVWDCTPTYPVLGVCPSGWHLPSKEEFETLLETVGGISIAGKKLKSTTGWKTIVHDPNGTDDFGFSAVPSGSRGSDGSYGQLGSYGDLWTATEDFFSSAYGLFLFSEENKAEVAGFDTRLAFPVRCVKNEL